MLNSESRLEVISNIKENTSHNELNKKVEPGDAVLTPEESDRLIKEYLARRKKLSFKTKSVIARKIADTVTEIEDNAFDSCPAGLVIRTGSDSVAALCESLGLTVAR